VVVWVQLPADARATAYARRWALASLVVAVIAVLVALAPAAALQKRTPARDEGGAAPAPRAAARQSQDAPTRA